MLFIISLLFACQFCTCSLDYGCCILLGSLTQRDLRRRKSKKYVIFSPCDLCVCIVQLIAASFVVSYASLLPSFSFTCFVHFCHPISISCDNSNIRVHQIIRKYQYKCQDRLEQFLYCQSLSYRKSMIHALHRKLSNV